MGNTKSVPETNASAAEHSEQQVTTADRSSECGQVQQNNNSTTSSHPQRIRPLKIETSGTTSDSGFRNENHESPNQPDPSRLGIAPSRSFLGRLLHRISTLDGLVSEDERQENTKNWVVANGKEQVETDSNEEEDGNDSELDSDGDTVTKGDKSQLDDSMLDSDLSLSDEDHVSLAGSFNDKGKGTLQHFPNHIRKVKVEAKENSYGSEEESDIEADLNNYSGEEEENDNTYDGVLGSDLEAYLNDYCNSDQIRSPDKNIEPDITLVDVEKEFELDEEAMMLYETYRQEHSQTSAEETLKGAEKSEKSSDDLQLTEGIANEEAEILAAPILDEEQMFRLSEECRSRPVQVSLNELQYRGNSSRRIEWLSTRTLRNGEILQESATSTQCPLAKQLVQQYELEVEMQKYRRRERSPSSDIDAVWENVNKDLDSLPNSTCSSPNVPSQSHPVHTGMSFQSSGSRMRTEYPIPCPFRGELCEHTAFEPCLYMAAVAKRQERINESRIFKPLKHELTKRIRLQIPPVKKPPKNRASKSSRGNKRGASPKHTSGGPHQRTRHSTERVPVPGKLFSMNTYSFELPKPLTEEDC